MNAEKDSELPGDRKSSPCEVWILAAARTPLDVPGRALQEVMPGALLASLIENLRARGQAGADEPLALDALVLGCTSDAGVRADALSSALARANGGALVDASLFEGGSEAGARAMQHAASLLQRDGAQFVLAGGIHMPSRDQQRVQPDVLGALVGDFVSPRTAADVAACLQGVTADAVSAYRKEQGSGRTATAAMDVVPVHDLNGLPMLAQDGEADASVEGTLEEPWLAHHALARRVLPQLTGLAPVHPTDSDAPAMEGAGLLLLGRREAAVRWGLPARARLVGFGAAGYRPLALLQAVEKAFDLALTDAGWSREDVQRLEVTSRFAGISLAVARQLKLEEVKLLRSADSLRQANAGAVSPVLAIARLVKDMEGGGQRRGALVSCGDSGGCIVVLVERGNND